jgi:predicted  nucleic acid-binding Zn-ribbon protein
MMLFSKGGVCIARGESVKCPYCGATIYAGDILERLKELMSKLE